MKNHTSTLDNYSNHLWYSLQKYLAQSCVVVILLLCSILSVHAGSWAWSSALDAEIPVATLTPGGQSIIMCSSFPHSDYSVLAVYDVQTGAVIHVLDSITTHEQEDMQMLTDGATVCLLHHDTVTVYNLFTGKKTSSFVCGFFAPLSIGLSNDRIALSIYEQGKVSFESWNGTSASRTQSFSLPYPVAETRQALSNDGYTLAVANDLKKDTIEFWNTQTAQLLSKAVTGEQASVRAIALSYDGSLCAIAYTDSVVLVSTVNGQLLRRFDNVSSGTIKLHFFDRDRRIAIRGSFYRLFDIQTGDKTDISVVGQSNDMRFSFAADTTVASEVFILRASHCGDEMPQIANAMVVRDLLQGQVLQCFPIGFHGTLSDGVISRSGHSIATSSGLGWTFVRDAADGSLLSFLPAGGVVCFVTDSTILLAYNNQVQEWGIPSRKILRTFSFDISGISFLSFEPEHGIVAIASASQILLWRYSDGMITQKWRVETPVSVAQFNQTGDALMVALPRDVYQWDIMSGKEILHRTFDSLSPWQGIRALSSDGQYAAVWYTHLSMTVRDVVNDLVVAPIVISSSVAELKNPVFTPDGRHLVYIVSGVEGDRIDRRHTLNLHTGEEVCPQQNESGAVLHAVSPDGRYLLASNCSELIHYEELCAPLVAVAGLQTAHTPVLYISPNPFSGETLIRFTLSRREHVRLTVTDILGNTIAVLVDDAYSSGEYQVSFAQQSAVGLCFVRLQNKGGVLTEPLILMK